MGWLLWVPVLLAAVWAAHWGAERLSAPLKKLRRRWGFSVAAGGGFIGIASASPEIAINTTSALQGVSEIGLGVILGSNVIAIPAIVATAYFFTRRRNVSGDSGGGGEGQDGKAECHGDGRQQKGDQSSGSSDQGGGGGHQGHRQHLEENVLAIDHTAVTVQALPYLVLVAIVAVLTLPIPGRGLQPIDGWVMLGAYVLYLAQALLRGREESEKVDWKSREIWMAVAGVGALAVGAFLTVLSTENIVQDLGISRVIGGLFITAPIATLPEIFATRSVARSGQITSAVTSVISDHAASLALAFLPLALVTLHIQNVLLFKVNLIFMALMPALYAAFIHWGGSEHGFRRWQVFALLGTLALWVFLIMFWVRPS